MNIEIPEDKQGDINYLVDEITAKMAAKGMTGRMSTWPVPCSMMFIEAGTEYSLAWINGEFTEKLNLEKVKQYFSEYASKGNDEKTDVEVTELVESGVKYDNYLMVLLDYLNF